MRFPPIDAPERSTRVQILWHTGATSELIATRPTIAEKFRTPNLVIQLIEELAPGRTDSEIADELDLLHESRKQSKFIIEKSSNQVAT